MTLRLKPGKEHAVKNRHRWIFSGAVADIGRGTRDGDVTDVTSSDGTFLAQAYVHTKSALTARILSFGHEPVGTVLDGAISRAWTMRTALFGPETDCYRIVNSEGDGIPGLIIDRYADVLVLQSTTLGIDRLLPVIVQSTARAAHAAGISDPKIYVKSTSPSRRSEGLSDDTRWLSAEASMPVRVHEDGISYAVDIVAGQKTGLFLDQREMRRLVAGLSRGKRVLNCFSYTGGFSLAALKGGAAHVTSVDVSETAIAAIAANLKLNGMDGFRHDGIVSDVFAFLGGKTSLDYGVVVLDPPAFAKTKFDVPEAMRAYRSLNGMALARMPKGSILVTSSCSYHVDPELFQKLLFQAALESRRNVRIIGRHRMAPDHPIDVFHPEGEYLKSLVLYVE